MPGPETPNFPTPPSVPLTDAVKEAQMRRLAMVLMGRSGSGGGAPQGPPQGLFGGLAQGLSNGYGFSQQQQLNEMMGIEPPWKRWFKSDPPPGGSGSAAP